MTDPRTRTYALAAGLTFAMLSACTNEPVVPATSATDEPTLIGTSPTKFAAVWDWTNVDKAVIERYLPKQSIQLKDLAKTGVAEAVYFDTRPPPDKAVGYPSISFVVNAKSADEAQRILDGMVFVENDVARYTLHPIGDRWLEENPSSTTNAGPGRRYVTVWTTAKGPGVTDRINELASKQTDAIQRLWRAGVIENVYFDATGVFHQNQTRDFVFFVRADDEEQARKIVDSLPFTIAKLATYEVYQVGALLDLR